jgi:vitamin B12 transporter
LSLALAAASLFAQSIGAQEPAREELDADAEQIVVFGVRTGELDPIPGASQDVLFTDDYTAEHKDLADLLSDAEGVYVRRFGGAGDRSELSIRGSSPSQVVVTIDGVRANSVLTGGLDLSRVCLPLLDRVEIVRGAGSTQEGSGAIGGVVNLVTRSAAPGSETRAAFSGGAFETYEGSALQSGWLGGLDYSLGYCGFATEGDFEFARPTETIDGVEIGFEPDIAKRLNNDRLQHGGTLALGAPLAGGEVRLSDYTAYSEGGEPGTDSGNGIEAGQATEARSRDWSNLAQLRWERASPSGLGGDLELALHHRYESTHFRNPVVLNAAPIDVDARLQAVGGRIADGWRKRWRRHSNELDLQIDGGHDWLRADDQRPRDRSRAAGALAETLRLFDERIAISLRARLDWAQRFGTELLPAAGLVLAPLPWLRLRGQAERAYRVPNFDELYHPDEGFLRGNEELEAEDALNFDAGVELRFAEVGPFSDLELRGGWFRREIDESIVWILINPRTIQPVNTGEATADGYELAASVRLTRFVRASANHTWIDSRREENGARLPGQPKHETFARLQLGPEEVWKLVGELQYVGEILVNAGGSRRLPERTVWNASAALNLVEVPGVPLERWITELWIFGAVDNIGDRAVRDAVSFPQPGRSATFGIEGHW